MNKKVDVVIVGAGLTGLTLGFYLKKYGKDVLILEKATKTGGVIDTQKKDGFIFETGPNTGIISSPELVELFDDLKNRVTLEIANPKAKNRWIWKGGNWRALPSGIFTAVFSRLFSLQDKLRILAEPFRKPGNNPHETVDQLILRRMGRSFLEYAVDPFISGIYAGDPARLVTRYALPKLYNLEQNYGSFVKGAIKKKAEPKTELEKRVSRDIFSVQGGLKSLTDALVNEIGSENIVLNASQSKIKPLNKGFNVEVESKGEALLNVSAKQVVTTVDSQNLISLLPFLQLEEINALSHLNYAKVVQVVACYKQWNGIKLNAFGGLIPSKENRNSLGILFPSSLFDGRAPKNGAVLSIFMGGIKKPEMIGKSDLELEKLALKEISETLKTDERPDILEIFRYQKAIPQYELSSGDRFKAIEKLENKYPGLFLAGNIRDGIGIPDRVKQAKQVALKMVDFE